jgi:hypothetical protein
MKKQPWFLLFTVLYPVTALYAANLTEVNVLYLIRPVVVSLLGGFMMFGLLWWILKDRVRAGFVSIAVLLIFSTYGIIYQQIEGFKVGSLLIGRHRFLGILMAVLLGVMIWRILRWRSGSMHTAVFYANIIALVLFLMPLGQVLFQAEKIKLPTARANQIPTEVQANPTTAHPDVYYFLLDSYSREDYIREEMKYDNSPFLNELRDTGFFVADCSLSNYSATRLSLASTLNMDYLDNLSTDFVPENKDETMLDPYILNSRVVELFREQGYKTVAFETGYPFTDLINADYHFTVISRPYLAPYLTAFEVLAMKNSMVSLLEGNKGFNNALGIGFEFNDKYQRQKFILSKVPSVPELPSPKFVFIHLVTTHRPYIFNPDGTPIVDKNYYLYEGFPANTETLIDGYQRVLQYTNAQLLPILKTILAESEQPPVIILQGDHGVLPPGRNTVLLSIFGLKDTSELAKDLSPVNIFPVIFNDLFKTGIPLKSNQFTYSNVNKNPFVYTYLDASQPCTIQ